MQGMMFCILALGWYLRKSGMIDKSGKALLSSLVMNVTLPASIVKSFQMEFSMNILKLTLERMKLKREQHEREAELPPKRVKKTFHFASRFDEAC